MHRILEILLGLDKGFLERQGRPGISFDPHWPWQQHFSASRWNLLLGLSALLLVSLIYRREGRPLRVRILLAVVRCLLVGFILMLLNNPQITLSTSHTEPSVVAVLIDDSISMSVHDGGPGGASEPVTRLGAVTNLLNGADQATVRELCKKHDLKFYRFDATAHPVGAISGKSLADKNRKPSSDDQQNDPDFRQAADAIAKVQPVGYTTQVISSIKAVLDDLQGQRIAGVLIFTDGRDTPAEPVAEALTTLKNYGVKVYPVVVGSEKPPQNIAVQSVNVQDSAFKGDIVNVRAVVRGTGYEAGHSVKLVLKDKRTGRQLSDADRRPVEKTIQLDGDKPQEVELLFKAEEVTTLDVQVEAVPQPGETDVDDNSRTSQVAVLDAQINVLYVDGYPRWEYRYVKNTMLREPTINISCILMSADTNFAQEGKGPKNLQYFPYKRFPETMEQLMECDVVVFGDVDPRQFTDAQLQLVSDFVSKKRGGFEMIAGMRWSPQAWRNTAIEDLLPVSVSRASAGDAKAITQGFRINLTKDGQESSIFRFFTDKTQNDKYVREQLQPLFWWCRGVTVKPGLGQVYAEHPTDIGPDGRPAPLLVVGQFGGGRTMFSGIDDSWRWRYYTGEAIFDTYWIQQFRYLARSKKLGERRMTFTSLRPVYERGEQVRLTLKILDSTLLEQLPDQIGVEILDADHNVIRHETLVRQEGQNDLYIGSFQADQVGKFTARVAAVAGGVASMELPVEITVPRLELSQPQADRMFLTRLASETLGTPVEFADAGSKLPALIPSAARVIPVVTSEPLWDAPLAMVIFVLLITVEWVIRKVNGML